MSEGSQGNRYVSSGERAEGSARKPGMLLGRRWPWAAGVAAAVVIGTAAILILATAQPGPEDPTRSDPTQLVRPARAAITLPTVPVAATVEQLREEAQRAADELRERFPGLPDALHVAALFHALVRETEKAEKLWHQCIRLDPKRAAYYVNLAAIAMDRGDSRLAEKTLREAMRAGCSSVDVDHHLGLCLTSQGRCDEAEQVLQKALAQYPRSGACWTALGEAQLKLGKAAEAETSLRKALALGSRSASVYFALANACARQGKNQQAAEYRKTFEELKTAQPLDKQQRFQVLSAAEARRNAVTILREAAAVHLRQENSLASEALLLRAIALDPADPETCRALAAIYQGAGMLAEERVVRQRLVEIEPHNPANYLHLAKVCAESGDPESAEAVLKLALAIRPQWVEGYASLAQFCLQIGKARHARWFAQEVLRRQPSREGYEFLATTCRALGDELGAQEAEALAQKFPAGAPQQTVAKSPSDE